MTRPSRNIDQILIKTALEMIPDTGFTGLKVRALAKKAGVNLAMFTYHFKTKDLFIERILSEVYEKFFNNLHLESTRNEDCLDRLRNSLRVAALFVRDHRELIVPFIEEIMMGNTKIMTFAKKNMTRHLVLIGTLISECQKLGCIIDAPLTV
ncbi:MAG: TetR/AcrR family transcriptional regulator, partial [Endomicrobiales bacterium]